MANVPKRFTFTYKDKNGYKARAEEAESTLSSYRDENWGAVQSSYTTVEDLYNAVMSAPEFTYDMQKDKLFQMFKEQYSSQGDTAMRNAMGMTSNGYNSSLAQTNAQSIYQGVQDAIAEKATQTYQAAYDRFNQNRQNQVNKLNAAQQVYQNKLNDYQQGYTEAQQNYNVANSAYQTDYNNQYQLNKDKFDYRLRRLQYNG